MIKADPDAKPFLATNKVDGGTYGAQESALRMVLVNLDHDVRVIREQSTALRIPIIKHFREAIMAISLYKKISAASKTDAREWYKATYKEAHVVYPLLRVAQIAFPITLSGTYLYSAHQHASKPKFDSWYNRWNYPSDSQVSERVTDAVFSWENLALIGVGLTLPTIFRGSVRTNMERKVQLRRLDNSYTAARDLIGDFDPAVSKAISRVQGLRASSAFYVMNLIPNIAREFLFKTHTTAIEQEREYKGVKKKRGIISRLLVKGPAHY